MNRCQQRAHVSEWMTKGRTTVFQKDPGNRTLLTKQLQTYKLPSDDVENIINTNKGRNLRLANKAEIVLWGTEKLPQKIQRHSRVILHRAAHPKREQDQREKLAIA